MELPHVLKISVYLCTHDYAEQCSFGGFGRCAGIGVPLSAVGWNVESFPFGTFVVNIVGSLLIGFLVGWVNRGVLVPEMKLLLVTGFCGGFTTFSTFANESFAMLKVGDALLSALYVALSVFLGILAVWLGSCLSGGVR